MSAIKVLVSDLGKVLLQFDVQRVWDALLPHLPVPEAEARRTVQAVFKETGFGRGGVDGPGFHRLLVQRTGLRLDYPAFRIAWSDMFWEDEAALEMVAEAPVRRRYLLTNTNPIHWEFIGERYPHALGVFDRLIASHELRLEKPDPEIYAWVIRDSGCAPGEHLFIDDYEENVIAARESGMDAILHTDSESLWRELVARRLATESVRPKRTEVVAATPPEQATWATSIDSGHAERSEASPPVSTHP